MFHMVETDQVAMYISLDQALFVLSRSQWCPRCGRPSRLFQYRFGRTACIGCSGPEPADENDLTDIVLPVSGDR